jgi:hypothetical protein
MMSVFRTGLQPFLPPGTTSAGTAGGPRAVRRIRRDLIVLAASVAVFAGCAVIVADGRVGPAERAVFHAINGLPGWLYRPMLAAQYLGCWPCCWWSPPARWRGGAGALAAALWWP